MKRFSSMINVAKWIVKYGAIVFVFIETVEFFIDKMEQKFPSEDKK